MRTERLKRLQGIWFNWCSGQAANLILVGYVIDGLETDEGKLNKNLRLVKLLGRCIVVLLTMTPSILLFLMTSAMSTS